mmetsp:Transcript_62974/g.182627  ORF Transcript_62974/g.182627 Transcript_62974/m.182627 type:complete len:283 (-) Transcript_62974:430-1278(-)
MRAMDVQVHGLEGRGLAGTQVLQKVVKRAAAEGDMGPIEGLVALQGAGGMRAQQLRLREVSEEHAVDLIELPRVQLLGVGVDVRCEDAVPIAEAPSEDHGPRREVEQWPLEPCGAALRHGVEAVAEAPLYDVGELVREDRRRPIWVRVAVQIFLAHVEYDVVIGDRLVRCRAGVVLQEVVGHYPCIFPLALLNQDVDAVGASVHERHGAHHLAFVVHPTLAPRRRSQLLDVVLVCVNLRCLDGHVFVQGCGALLEPDIDEPGDDGLQSELAAAVDPGVQENE